MSMDLGLRMWVIVFRIALLVVYCYVIGLSLWATRVQLKAATAPHHPHDHPAMSHVVERSFHGYIARVLIASLAVRLIQLNYDLTLWLLVPLTVWVALWTTNVLFRVWRMAMEDMHSWRIGALNKAKTLLLLVCTAAILADQVWRVVTLFWLRSTYG